MPSLHILIPETMVSNGKDLIGLNPKPRTSPVWTAHGEGTHVPLLEEDLQLLHVRNR